MTHIKWLLNSVCIICGAKNQNILDCLNYFEKKFLKFISLQIQIFENGEEGEKGRKEGR